MNLRQLMAIAVFLLAPLTTLHASEQRAYSHDSGRKTTNTDWMAKLPDNTYLSRLSLPGTHDTMARYGVENAKTQTMSLEDQMKSGIRALDIRCAISGEHLVIFHGSYYQNANFDDVLTTTTNFLRDHPRETIVMRISKEHDEDDAAKFEEIFAKYYEADAYKDYFYVPQGRVFWASAAALNPELGMIRKKIVILQDFVSKTTPATLYGIDWNSFDIQDNWKLDTNWALYDKWTAVKNQLSKAYDDDFRRTNIYVNFLTGNYGSFPYFVSSGKSSPGTNDPLLWTGLVTTFGTNKDTYVDFPRLDCVKGFGCSIYFYGTNQLTANWLGGHTKYPSRVGMIFADYPGGELIDNVIKANRL